MSEKLTYLNPEDVVDINKEAGTATLIDGSLYQYAGTQYSINHGEEEVSAILVKSPDAPVKAFALVGQVLANIFNPR